ncbi:MAG: class I SAM-dependent methyltransferase [Usitatibacteraceae bacterium]
MHERNEAAQQFSALYPVMNDAARRRNRGLKTAAILREALGERKIITILDIGCSNALLLDTVVEELVPVFAIGIDMDAAAAPPPNAKRAVLVGDAMALPLSSGSVDVVICNHTYEHVPYPQQLFSEIERVLTRDGLVYFSAMNASWPIEPHYHLPFSHWLPQWIAKRILAARGHPGGYLERPLTRRRLVDLVYAFEIHDYTIKVIADPKKYHASEIVRFPAFGPIYRIVALALYGLLPGYLWVLKKRAHSAPTLD